MSTTVTGTNTNNYTTDSEMTYENGVYQTPSPNGNVNQSNSDDLVENNGKMHFKPAPAKAKDHKRKWKAAPAKARDYSNESTNTTASPTNKTSSDNQTNSTTNANNSTTNQSTEDYSKKSGTELLIAFRNGDEKLLKALNENPALMQKLIDQMHMEERNIELISNYNKSKDDALKTIIHNMK
ncbi:MAG: hypothetical protein ACP5QK_00235 [Myxococcota bacterium]